MKQKDLTITLPQASTCPGRLYMFKNISGGNNKTNTEYRCNKGMLMDKLSRNKIVWLQSDGQEWQQINIQH